MCERKKLHIALPATGEEEWQALREPVMGGWLTQGPKVAAFERTFAQYHNVPHALATTSCTTALHLILAALGVGPGDEVILPSFTWIATANVVVHCGATPVFVDVCDDTYNLDAERLSAAITTQTKAIVAVHLFGLCADMDTIMEIAGDIPVIEDAACATGAEYKGKYAGSLGRAAAFSFHPRKVITTGEGGMVTTGDARLFEKMNRLRNHGASLSEEMRHRGPRPYELPEFTLAGFNYRMTDLQGAVGLVQLGKLENFIEERRKLAEIYRQEIESISWLSCPYVPDGCNPTWQSYVCMVDSEKAPATRNEIMDYLLENGVSTRPGTHAVHQQEYYRQRYGLEDRDFPVAAHCASQSLALPMHNRMDREDCCRVAALLKRLG